MSSPKTPFAIGQRWISQTEPKLGLGIVTEIENRRLSVSFPAAGEHRVYAAQNAPISRIVYKVGDPISDNDDRHYKVLAVDDKRPIVLYQVEDSAGQISVLTETELNCFIEFTSPLQRLSSGHFDRNAAFRLRYDCLQHKNRLQTSAVTGLLGARTMLLPHQIYIAHTVASRFAPRVLLADEVGLGKTIEAGLILHAQLHRGLARRVLIVVPPTLVHQWLVEMLRRFNLVFSVFDLDRYESLRSEGVEKPFETEQLIIASLDLFSQHSAIAANASASDWDLLVVDEAHHLHWQEDVASPEYLCVEALARQSRGVLLLTATPEQAGIESHFARLRLLDPDRFHSLAVFREQEARYGEVSALVGELQQQPADTPLSPEWQSRLSEKLGVHSQLDFAQPAAQILPDIIQQLIDRHGTGRVLFRNTRQSVAGFPQRVLHPYPLPIEDPAGVDESFTRRRLWLIDWLPSVKGKKVLIICHSADDAMDLEEHLRLREGKRTALFHEGMSIIERDRAAAYFADLEEGAQLLICSEIGSEGRNFQFAHHLVLFDLPDNPDLLEQRIGRLDRIGQMGDVNIHVPYCIASEQEGLFHWYHEGLLAFEQSCSAGYAIYEHFAAQLSEYLSAGDYQSSAAQSFIQHVREYRDSLVSALQQGRDPLLELNSCNAEKAEQLIEQIEWEEDNRELTRFMDNFFAVYGVEMETQTDQSIVIHPGEHMLTPHFPGLNEEGNTLTFHRLKATAREDIEFLSWEHPMVRDCMEMLLSSELGNAALSTLSVKGVQPGTLLLEALFSLNSMAPRHLQLDRFLPVSPQRFLVDINGRDLSGILTHERLNELCQGIKHNLGLAVIKEVQDEIPKLVQHAQKLAEQGHQALLDQARQQLQQGLEQEIARMQALQAVNPLIRDEEIAVLRERLQQSQQYIDRAGLEVQALRMIVCA